MDIFPLKINIVVMDVVNDVTYSRKSVNTRAVITLLLHDVIHRKTAMSYDKTISEGDSKLIKATLLVYHMICL